MRSLSGLFAPYATVETLFGSSMGNGESIKRLYVTCRVCFNMHHAHISFLCGMVISSAVLTSFSA